MALQKLEKLDTSIVILPAGDLAPELSLADLKQVVREPQIEAMPAPINMLRITSLRDQVEIRVGQGRIQIRDDSDNMPGTDRFIGVISGFASLLTRASSTTYRAFGWNFSVAFDPGAEQLPAETIMQMFINVDAIRRATGLTLVGGAIRLFYNKEDALCFLHLEPRENKLDATRFFAHVNVHYDMALPQREKLADLLQRDYRGFIDVLSAMLA